MEGEVERCKKPEYQEVYYETFPARNAYINKTRTIAKLLRHVIMRERNFHKVPLLDKELQTYLLLLVEGELTSTRDDLLIDFPMQSDQH